MYGAVGDAVKNTSLDPFATVVEHPPADRVTIEFLSVAECELRICHVSDQREWLQPFPSGSSNWVEGLALMLSKVSGSWVECVRPTVPDAVRCLSG